MLHSIVIPVFNEREGIEPLYQRLSAVLSRLAHDFEVILVNDGSTDDSGTRLDSLHERDCRFKVIHLSRNMGHQAAITAGMKWASGRTVTVMDADLQDPPELIPRFLEEWRSGFDVVHGVRIRREGETHFKRWTASVFYRLIRVGSSVSLPVDSGDFRLMDRKVIDAFLLLKERNRYVRGMVSWMGFRQAEVRYERRSRERGATHFSVRKMIRFAWDGMISFSDLPVRVLLWYGLSGTVTSGTVLVSRLVSGPHEAAVPAVLLTGHLIILSCGLLGLYLVRIYDEVRARPLFIVERTRGFQKPARKADFSLIEAG